MFLITRIVVFVLIFVVQMSWGIPLSLKCQSSVKSTTSNESLVRWHVNKQTSGDENTGMLETSLQFGRGEPIQGMSRFLTREILGKKQTIVNDARVVPMFQRYNFTLQDNFKIGTMNLGSDVPADDKGDIPLADKIRDDFMSSFNIDSALATEWTEVLLSDSFEMICGE